MQTDLFGVYSESSIVARVPGAWAGDVVWPVEYACDANEFKVGTQWKLLSSQVDEVAKLTTIEPQQIAHTVDLRQQDTADVWANYEGVMHGFQPYISVHP